MPIPHKTEQLLLLIHAALESVTYGLNCISNTCIHSWDDLTKIMSLDLFCFLQRGSLHKIMKSDKARFFYPGME